MQAEDEGGIKLKTQAFFGLHIAHSWWVIGYSFMQFKILFFKKRWFEIQHLKVCKIKQSTFGLHAFPINTQWIVAVTNPKAERMLFLSDNQYQVAIHDKVHYGDEMNVYMIANDCKKIGRSNKLYHHWTFNVLLVIDNPPKPNNNKLTLEP